PVQQWQPGKRLDRVLEGARHREEGGDARWGLMVDLEDELDADRVTGEGGLLDAGVVEHLDEVGGDALDRDVLGAKARGVEAGRTCCTTRPATARHPATRNDWSRFARWIPPTAPARSSPTPISARCACHARSSDRRCRPPRCSREVTGRPALSTTSCWERCCS